MRGDRNRRNVLGGRLWIIGLLLLISATGCVTGTATKKVEADSNLEGMWHYQKNGVDMYLSAIWKETDIPPGQQKDVKAWFESALGGQIGVACFSSWVSNMQLQEIMMSTLSPKARVYTEPTCIENYSGAFKPCYGIFKDVIVEEGEETTVTLYMAWKGTMFGCKYGIFGSGIIGAPDFVRMIGSIK